jgi:GTP cyclohydrolase II
LSSLPSSTTTGGIDHAVAAFRCGTPLVLAAAAGGARLVQAAEGATAGDLARLARLGGSWPCLALTRQRGIALGAVPGGHGVLILPLASGIDVADLRSLVDPIAPSGHGPRHLATIEPAGPGSCEAAAVRLATLAGLLPAALVAALPAGDVVAWSGEHHVALVEVEAVLAHQAAAADRLRPVIEARVPLAKAEDTRVVVFRSDPGGVEHLAIIVGQPRPGQPVLARLHSECFTGDLLGSLRCDCGDQLHRAIEAMAAARDGGVLLYLAQEGRGIGLVNKLRAYVLQDRGFDTLEANEQLGFEPDERCYRPAAEMLRKLGFTSVRLMTNNPEKVAALVHFGIRVVQRIPLALPPNVWNAAYLQTKRARAGHLLDLPAAAKGLAAAPDEGQSEAR